MPESKKYMLIKAGLATADSIQLIDGNGEEGFEAFNGMIGAETGEVVSLSGIFRTIKGNGDIAALLNGIASMDLWCDGEGLFKEGNQINRIASGMSQTHIVGDVVLMLSDKEGNSLPLGMGLVRVLMTAIGHAEERYFARIKANS